MASIISHKLFRKATSLHKQQDSLLVSGYIHRIDIFIPNEIMSVCFQYYHLLFTIGKFSERFCSLNAFIFSDNNKTATHDSDVHHTYKYILADMDPVYKGIHCWRIQVNNPSQGWSVWGVATPKKYNDYYKNKGAYGVTKWAQYYPRKNAVNGSPNNVVKDKYWFLGQKKCEIDIYLNADSGELKICTVGMLDKGEARMHKLPKNTGWVPYFNMCSNCKKMQLKIAKIPIKWYSVADPYIWK